jgi:hypothetical protein
VLKAQLVTEKAAPYCVRWVRQFLTRPAANEPVADQVRRFCEELERNGACQDWQVRQAEQALRIYFVNFLQRLDWHRQPASTVVDEQGRADPLAALEQLRTRLRTRHYSYRTECSYADWVRRFFAYVAERQGAPHPRVEPDAVRDYLTHLAVRQRVSASTQNQALCAVLFLCREVLGVNAEGLSDTARAKRGAHLPVVLSVPETAALLGAMQGTTWVMAEIRLRGFGQPRGNLLARAGEEVGGGTGAGGDCGGLGPRTSRAWAAGGRCGAPAWGFTLIVPIVSPVFDVSIQAVAGHGAMTTFVLPPWPQARN